MDNWILSYVHVYTYSFSLVVFDVIKVAGTNRLHCIAHTNVLLRFDNQCIRCQTKYQAHTFSWSTDQITRHIPISWGQSDTPQMKY